MRLAWLTDIHLDFVRPQNLHIFLNQLMTLDASAFLITGDIAEAHDFHEFLVKITNTTEKPIYFVLGNHDYYGSTIANTRQHASMLHRAHKQLQWLPKSGVVSLSEDTYLVGHGAWSDGGYGDFMRSSVMLTDYMLIQDFRHLSLERLHQTLLALGQEAANYLRDTLTPIMPYSKKIIVAMHSPPFQEATWHEGKTPADDDEYLPHFSCKAVGDVLHDLAQQYPDTPMQVLCGHTHGSGESQILPNLHVITGGAVYEKPAVQRVFEY